MNTTVDQKPEGLRARKRRATENAIETSAVKLALEHGVENVTVEAICEMADISRSTFFNYFPARDYAIVGRAISIPEGSEAFSILDTAPKNLPLGLYRLLFAAIGHRNVNTEVARLRMQLLAEQPEAARMSQISMLETSGPLLMTTMAWLQAHPEHRKLDEIGREAWLASSIVHSIVSAQMMEWAQGAGDMETDESGFHDVIADFQVMLDSESTPS
ncbi:TetR family transcriptional regulator [Leucobacter salsicius]|uniref:TetR family transcriptional regulator n=1 Tax=Leucobacter salsicius TaxID=664638 RepID=UPI00034807B2|nr:TetR family transcriptional regulator [Leucobacter salsicius]